MTASNHFATGALIGASIANPWVAAPLAVASHFLLDAMPQYGYEGPKEKKRAKFTLFHWALILDTLMAAICIWALTFVVKQPELVVFGLLGYSPDIVWLYKFSITEKFGKRFLPNDNWFTNFHARIQKLEHPLLIIWEVVFFVAVFTLLIWVSA